MTYMSLNGVEKKAFSAFRQRAPTTVVNVSVAISDSENQFTEQEIQKVFDRFVADGVIEMKEERPEHSALSSYDFAKRFRGPFGWYYLKDYVNQG